MNRPHEAWLSAIHEPTLSAIEDSRHIASSQFLLYGSVVLSDEVIAEIATTHGLSESQARACLIVGQGEARRDTGFMKKEVERWDFLDG